MIQVPTQIATSFTSDFEEVWDGEFAIIDKPVFDRLITEREEIVDLFKKLVRIQFEVDIDGEQKASMTEIMQIWASVQEMTNKLQTT